MKNVDDEEIQAAVMNNEPERQNDDQNSNKPEDPIATAAAQPSSGLLNALEEVSRAWLAVTQEQVRTQVNTLKALSQCRSLHEIVAAHGSVVREHIFSALESNQRLT